MHTPGRERPEAVAIAIALTNIYLLQIFMVWVKSNLDVEASEGFHQKTSDDHYEED